MRKINKGVGTQSYKLKEFLCGAILDYAEKNGLTKARLSEALDINSSIVSRIASFQVEKFTADRLVEYLGKLGLTLEAKIQGGKAKGKKSLGTNSY